MTPTVCSVCLQIFLATQSAVADHQPGVCTPLARSAKHSGRPPSGLPVLAMARCVANERTDFSWRVTDTSSALQASLQAAANLDDSRRSRCAFQCSTTSAGVTSLPLLVDGPVSAKSLPMVRNQCASEWNAFYSCPCLYGLLCYRCRYIVCGT